MESQYAGFVTPFSVPARRVLTARDLGGAGELSDTTARVLPGPIPCGPVKPETWSPEPVDNILALVAAPVASVWSVGSWPAQTLQVVAFAWGDEDFGDVAGWERCRARSRPMLSVTARSPQCSGVSHAWSVCWRSRLLAEPWSTATITAPGGSSFR